MTEHAAEHEHDYHAEHPDWPADYEPGTEQDLAVGTIIYVTVVGTIITFVIVLLLKHMYFQAREHEMELKNYHTVFEPMAELKQTQLQQLDGYSWRDAQAGVITIPINLAMSQVVDEYQHGRSDAVPPISLAAAPAAGANASGTAAAPPADGQAALASGTETPTEGAKTDASREAGK